MLTLNFSYKSPAADSVPALKKNASAQEIQNHDLALADAIRKARPNAKPGDIVSPDVKPVFAKLLRHELTGQEVRRRKRASKREIRKTKKPVKVEPVIAVNAVYPKNAPLSTVPPSLLLRLPKLPKDIEYPLCWPHHDSARPESGLHYRLHEGGCAGIMKHVVFALALAGFGFGQTVELPNKKDSFHFAVIGDTGTGGSHQYEIAQQLARFHGVFSSRSFMVGDNLYGGEKPHDFAQKFERPYEGLLANGVKFYANVRQS